MVTRSSTVVVVASCLAIGLGVGFSLGRGGRVVTAQVGGVDRGQENPVPPRIHESAIGAGRQGRVGRLRSARARIRAVPARGPDVRAGLQGGLAVGRPHRHDEDPAGPEVRGDGIGRDRPRRQEPGALRPDESSRGRRRQGGQDPDLPERRPLPDAGADLERRQGRHRRAQARSRRPAGRPDGQQRRRPRSGPGCWPWGARSA